jgi:hypothetical protein
VIYFIPEKYLKMYRNKCNSESVAWYNLSFPQINVILASTFRDGRREIDRKKTTTIITKRYLQNYNAFKFIQSWNNDKLDESVCTFSFFAIILLNYFTIYY